MSGAASPSAQFNDLLGAMDEVLLQEKGGCKELPSAADCGPRVICISQKGLLYLTL